MTPGHLSPNKIDSQHDELARSMTVDAVPEAAKIEGGIVVLDSALSGRQGSVRLAADGKTVLLPQPTDDISDPLNLSWTKKHLILLTVAWCALCADWTGATGPVVIFQQAAQWSISADVANRPNSINVLMNGIGSLIWVPAASFWGRAPILFWTSIFGLAASIGAAVAPTYAVYFAMRALSGLFLTAGQTMVIAVLKDIFFFHERARKIGLWATLYVASPYLGPCIGSFVIYETGQWTDVFWVCAGVVGLQLILVVAFIDETWYNRGKHHGEQLKRSGDVVSRLSRVTGIWQVRHHRQYFPGFWITCQKFALIITRPVVALVCLSYLMVFAWAIGINISATIFLAQPQEIGGYGYTNRTIGFLYFTPIVGTFIGEIFGHYFNDWIARRYIRNRKGVFEPEVRLWTIYISICVMVPSLVLIGQALELRLNVGALIIGWGAFAFGIMTMSVACTAYLVDSYPSAPAELGGWLNFARTFGGFSVGYFQTPWEAAVGADGSFGTQAAIVAVAVIPVVITHLYGHRLRLRYPVY